jgi:tetrapyrrole methylase family protein / MazG family protein
VATAGAKSRFVRSRESVYSRGMADKKADAPAEEIARRFADLVALVAKLRGPDGCPWDREQSHESIKGLVVEEAYEVVEAIDEGDDGELRAELGDLLLQVVFHSQIAEDEQRFAVGDVIETLQEKLVRRHPHVFGGEKAGDSGEVLKNWEALKEAERAAKGQSGPDASMLDSVSRSLPATLEAHQLTTKVSRVGFDWPNADDAIAKLEEEIDELKSASRGPAGSHAIEVEIGDLLFTVVNLARLLAVDPETALKASSRKFRRRFRYIEDRLREQGSRPADSTLEVMDGLWNEAKQHEDEAVTD